MKKLILLFFTVICLSGSAFAQKDTVLVNGVKNGGGEGSLNNAIAAAQQEGKLSETVFKLVPFDIYILTSSVITAPGEHLEIVAPKPGTSQQTAPPQIIWSSSGDITTDFMFQLFGDVTMKNVWIRYANAEGNQVSSSIQIEDQPGDKQETAVFDGVIFEYGQVPPNSSGAIGVTADHFHGTFKNSYFRNMVDPHYRYYGRALSFPYETTGWHYDYVLFENTTFANMGYVLMQEGGEYGDNVHFNHCTFLNIAMFALESGWWNKMSVTNSVFVNPFMFGYIPAQGDPNGGIFQIQPVDSFGFDVDFTDLDRQILLSHTSYVYEDWLIDWMENNPYSQSLYQQRRDDEIPLPHPYLNDYTLAFIDSTDENGDKVFKTMNVSNMYIDVDPGFINPATNVEDLKTWLQYKWDNNADLDWSFDPESGYNHTWPLPENMAYTNSTLLTAGMGDFPLGDLYNWFPEKYTEWEAQRDEEWQRINTWLQTGTDPLGNSIVENPPARPSGFELSQNYPNPFNPSTQIAYTLPEAADISLKVYNALGQEVASLAEGRKAAGSYTITFNASALTSGVYYYRLQAANNAVSITRKLTLIK